MMNLTANKTLYYMKNICSDWWVLMSTPLNGTTPDRVVRVVRVVRVYRTES